MNNVLTLKGSGASVDVFGSGNHVFNGGSGKNKSVTFNDPGNALDSRRFYSNYQEKYSNGEDNEMKVTDIDGKEKKGASSLEQEHTNVSDASLVSNYNDSGPTIVIDKKMPNLETLITKQPTTNETE